MCELATLAERRTCQLNTGSLSSRLPPLLIHRDRPGLGTMVPQTTAAALVAENRALAWPATADSIPTCEDQEDVVAMSTTAARRAREVVSNSRKVVAIELLTATNALQHRLSEEPGVALGVGAEVALGVLTQILDDAGELPSDEIAAIERALISGELVRRVVERVGPLAPVLP